MKLPLLREIFAVFLRTRRVARHFRRLLPETLAHTGVSRRVPPAMAQTLVAAARSDVDALLRSLGSASAGLTEEGEGGAKPGRR